MAVKAVAPWVRTRLKAAPMPSVALALLVLVTSFLAAAFPRAVDTYETRGLRLELGSAGPERSGIEVSLATGDEFLDAAPGEVDAGTIRDTLPQVQEAIEDPLVTDRSQVAYGVQTKRPLDALDAWLPRPEGKPPAFMLAAQGEVDRHARVVQGRLPKGDENSATSMQAEAAVTTDTAKTLKIKVGSVIHFLSDKGPRVSVKVTGIVEPKRPEGSYWSFDSLLRTPAIALTPPAPVPAKYWQAGLLLAPEAAAFLIRLDGNPNVYWRLPPRFSSLEVADIGGLQESVASLEGGPALSRMRESVGERVSAYTELDRITGQFLAAREAITPVVSIAAYGIGAVALVVLLMTGALAAARRSREVALLRARGGSVRGITARICAETAVVAIPAAALGWLLAVLVRPEGRLQPSVAGAGLVALLACVALPVRAVVRHLRLRAHGGREDLVDAKPSRRRTVAELTALVLAVGAVVAMRRRGSGEADGLVSAAPVLVALIAALLLVRLYPLPIRWAGRPLLRRRGAIGFLSLARAGRTSSAQALPLLALLVALTTAAFGGSVIAGIGDARDEAALRAVGADLRINARPNQPLPDGLAERVDGLGGVREVSRVYMDGNMRMPDGGKEITLIAVDPESYARLSERTGLGPFPAGELKAPGSGPAPAFATPAVAKRLGSGEHALRTPVGDFTAKVTGIREITPASFGVDFLLIDASRLKDREDTALFATGGGFTTSQVAKEIDAAAGSGAAEITYELRAAERATMSDGPLQEGAETVYAAAVAAGAGYAILAVLLSLLQTAPERTALVARLRTMGLGRGQARRLLVLEALPQALLAAAGGVLVALAAMELIAPGLDLGQIALAAQAEAFGEVQLRMDSWSLLVPAGTVVLLATGVALVQAWWTARQTSLTELRAGDGR
ncbi:FtsX-like permease family protein [Streptomyces indicus]|uniref:Putative ABC transport system permease protein n=1 Tax=Streptomyces indicus TaxID=417292 RepID=A0A1G9GCT0_9ACTN|nr:FtsX-like permease family protein [Streptomyces indicus]SDK98518.1 putative ABC transport system permease protein [Streptomyces indicus]